MLHNFNWYRYERYTTWNPGGGWETTLNWLFNGKCIERREVYRNIPIDQISYIPSTFGSFDAGRVYPPQIIWYIVMHRDWSVVLDSVKIAFMDEDNISDSKFN